MRKSGLNVPLAALLSGLLAAGAAAQETRREFATLPPGAAVAGTQALHAGNPLWAISVTELSQTQARPLFSPGRRPPAPGVAALPTTPPRAAAPSRAEPDHPLLTLVGTIVGASVEIAVFIDEASHDVIRLKAGEAHDGWILRSVSGRAAIFGKDGDRAAILALPASGGKPPASNNWITGVPPASTIEPPVIPAATKGARRPPREG